MLNKTEAASGVLIILLSFFAILAIFTGVGKSVFMPERYAWDDAGRAYYFMVFLPVLGLATIVHGERISKTSELILGIVILFWSFFSWLWIPLNIQEGSLFFKGGFTEEFILTSWPLIVFIFLGIALAVNSIEQKLAASAANNMTVPKQNLKSQASSQQNADGVKCE